MNLFYLAALIAACGADKLDRTYLPPPSAAFAGGSPGSLQTPFSRTVDQASQNVPPGGFVNEHQGVVVEAAAAGTRASNQQSGLGGPRISYGSTDSKVGDAAFRVNPNQFVQGPHQQGHGSLTPDLSAFHQPYRPGNIGIVRDYVSNTLKYHNDVSKNKFNYGYETDNGIKAAENGIAVDGVQAQGGFSYTGNDGQTYSVTYTADEDGFRPQGSHLPTPPPIPFEILESLEQNAKDEAAGIIDDGSYDAQKYNTDDDYTKTDANGKYNDRQSNKFGKRPESNTDSRGTFINQNKQGFVTPNFNGQFGFTNDASKLNSFKPDATKFGGASGFDNQNNAFALGGPQSGYRNQFGGTGFGSRNDYLPPNSGNLPYNNIHGFNTYPGSSSFGTTSSSNFNSGKPFTQQNFQTQNSFGKPQSSFVRPSSYDTLPGVISQSPHKNSDSSVNSAGQGLGSNFIFGNSPTASSQYFNKPQESGNQFLSGPNSYNPVFPQNSFSQSFASGQPFATGQSFSFPGFGDKNPQQFLTPHGPIQYNQNLNARLPTTQFGTSPDSSNPSQNNIGQSQSPTQNSFGQNQNTNNPNKFGSITSFSSAIPTKKPVYPTDSNGAFISMNPSKTESSGLTRDSTGTDSQSSQFPVQNDRNKESSLGKPLSTLNEHKISDVSTSSFDSSPKTTSDNFGKTPSQISTNDKPQSIQGSFASSRPDLDFVSNTQRPNISQSSQFSGQPIGADDSYIYNRPSTPFNTPSFQFQSIGQPNDSLNQFKKPTQLSTSQTIFSNPPQVSSFDTQTQSQSGLNKYPGTSTIVPSSSLIKDNGFSKNPVQNINGVTQASISPFPSITPTISSNYKQQSNQFNTDKLQQTQLSTTSHSEFSPVSTSSATTTEDESSKFDKQNNKQQSHLSQQPLVVEGKPNDGINKISKLPYNTEIFEYNKPAQELPTETKKEDNVENIPNFDQQKPQPILGGQYSIPINQQSSNQKVNNIQQGQQPQFGSQSNIQFNQQNTPSYQKSKNQSPQSGIQPNTQTTQSFGNKESTTQFQQPGTQSNYNPSTFFPSTVPGVEFSTQKQDSHTFNASPQNPTTGLQTSTLFGTSDKKGTTISEFEQPNQQTITQFDYKPTTTFASSFATSFEFNPQNQVVPSVSPQTPDKYLAQFEIHTSPKPIFDNKATTLTQTSQSNIDSVSPFDHKSITSIPNSPQTQYSEFNTQATILPSQSGDESNTPESFDSKKSTIAQYQKPAIQFSTTFDQTYTSIPSATQTEVPLGSTRVPPFTEHESLTGSKYNTGSTLVPNTPSEKSTSYTQEAYQPSTTGEIYDYTKPVQGLPSHPQKEDADVNQKKPQDYKQASLKPGQGSFGLRESTASQTTQATGSKYNTGSTLVQSTPSEQSTFYTQETDQPSTTGEIYDYTKPVQGLPSQSQKEDADVNHKKPQGYTQANLKPGQGSIGVREPTISLTTQATGPKYNTGSTLAQSTPSEQSTVYNQETDQPSTTGEIYDYTKPVQGLPSQSQKEDAGVNHKKPQGYTQASLKPGQGSFGVRQPITSLTTQATGPKYNTGSTLAQSTPSEQSTFYTQETDQPSTTGEIYDYTKPVQGLPSQSQKEDAGVNQKKPQGYTQASLKPGQGSFGVRQPTTSLTTQTSGPKYNTGSTLAQSTPSEQSTFYTQETDQPSTTGEIYDYTKPVQGLPSQSQKEDADVNHKKPQGYTQANLKPGQGSFGAREPTTSVTKQTSGPKYNTGSTLAQSTPSEQSTSYTQETDQPSTTGEIYDYTKPVQGLPSQSQKEDADVNQKKPQGYTQGSLKPDQGSFGVRQPITSLTTQATGPKYNSGSTLAQSTPPGQSTFYTQETDQPSTTGEIYDYTKPAQGLLSQSQKEEANVNQKKPQGYYTQASPKPDQSSFGVRQPTTSQTTQTLPDLTQTQANPDFENADTLTSQSPFSQGSPSSKKPLGSLPQLSFHSACCQGNKNQKNQGTAPVTHDNNGLSPSVGADAFDQNKNAGDGDQGKNNGQTQGSNLAGPQDFGPQKGSQTYAGIGEQFSVSRQPPRYDETGYHY